MSDPKSTGSSHWEVVTAIMTALGPIFGSIVGELLSHWIKQRKRSSQAHDEESKASVLASNMLVQLGKRVNVLENSQQGIQQCCCRSHDQIEPTNSSGDDGRSSDS